MSFNFAPKGWALCNGQTLPINQNQALFSLLGTTYGGNGQTTFQLPNLQGRIPMHFGGGFALGQVGGETAHTVIINELPQHTHGVTASGNAANASTAPGNFFANGNQPAYNSAPNGSLMLASSVVSQGGNQPHNNMSPYLTLNFCIALQGIFPSRS